MRRRQKGDRRNQRVPGRNVPRIPHCPEPCGKMMSPSRADAVRLYNDIAGRRRDSEPVRFYECDVILGAWHWTRKVNQ